jgi:hypothetical protein
VERTINRLVIEADSQGPLLRPYGSSPLILDDLTRPLQNRHYMTLPELVR